MANSENKHQMSDWIDRVVCINPKHEKVTLTCNLAMSNPISSSCTLRASAVSAAKAFLSSATAACRDSSTFSFSACI